LSCGIGVEMGTTNEVLHESLCSSWDLQSFVWRGYILGSHHGFDFWSSCRSKRCCGFGYVTSARDPRIMQVALKLLF
jgi:hypothetical protein